MNLLSDVFSQSGIFDLLIIAAVMLYAASRVIRQTWEHTEANVLRNAIAWALFVFGAALFFLAFFKIANDKSQGNQPSIQQEQLPNPHAQSTEQGNVPKKQNDSSEDNVK